MQPPPLCSDVLLHTLHPPRRTPDVLAFSIIFVTTRRPGLTYPGIPSLLNTILRDATYYFILMFACQLCLLLFLFFAPVSDP